MERSEMRKFQAFVKDEGGLEAAVGEKEFTSKLWQRVSALSHRFPPVHFLCGIRGLSIVQTSPVKALREDTSASPEARPKSSQ